MTEKTKLDYNKVMQFQVPQFIETEDKIVGPFTLRQFMYIGAGGLISAILYFMVQPWLWFLLTIIVIGAAMAVAFIKVEGRSLFDVLLSAFGFYWKPQTYIWKSEEEETRPAVSSTESGGISLENIIAGAALHRRWETLQTGEKMPEKKIVETRLNSRYQIFEKVTGDRQAAKRVDYR
jgi:hypothetical protein